jgi:predicted transcriptional regulator
MQYYQENYYSTFDEPMIFSLVWDDEDSSYTSCVTPDGNYHIMIAKRDVYQLIIQNTGIGSFGNGTTNYRLNLSTPCSIVQMNSDGSLVATGGSRVDESNASHVYVYNTTTRELVLELPVPHQHFELSPNGNYLSINDKNSYSGIYWVANGTLFKKLSNNYELLKFSPNSRYIAAYNNSSPGRIEILSFPDLKNVHGVNSAIEFSLNPGRSGIFSWSIDGQYLAIVQGSNNSILILEPDTWITMCKITTNLPTFKFSFVSFSPNGSLLAVGGSNLAKTGISLGLQLYETKSWSKGYDEPNQLDFEELKSHNSKLRTEDKLIFETLTWLPDGSVFISATYYRPIDSSNSSSGSDDATGFYSNLVPIFLVFIVIVVLVSIYGFLFYFRPYIAPWYSKLRPDELKNQATRSKILDYVQMHPGCIFSEIKGSMKGSYSNLYYHLSVLEREELIFTKTSGFRKRFYSINYPKFSSMFPQIQDHGIHEKIFMLLLNHPGLTQKEIANQLSISEATVSRYIIDLLTEKFIRRERHGKVWRCYANPYSDT